MAYVKIKCIRSSTHLQQAIDYIKNPNKTENCTHISSFMCSTKNTAFDFEMIAQEAKKCGNQIAHHICQSFLPEDSVTPEQALAIGQELMRRFYPNHQYIIATHNDQNHIHNHIIINSVNFEDYKKLRNNSDNLQSLRSVSDDVCKENGLSVIVPEEKNKRARLKNDIDAAIKTSNTFEEFLVSMQAKNYEIKRGKYLYFKGEYGEVFFNTQLLGSAYTEKNIRKRIANHTPLKNRKVQIYDDKIVKMPYRKRLKYAIDDAMKRAEDYNDFIRLMKERDYEIKFGKHLAFRHITAKRYIRCESVGATYTEDMLKLYFNDRESYDTLKETFIERLVVHDKTHSSKYAEIQNINIQIRMLNYLRENNIKSYEELAANIERCQKKVDINNQNIVTLNTQIAEKRELIKSIRAYWQYKPYMAGLHKCRNEEERVKYKADNAAQLDKFTKSINILNQSKKADGTLPKASDLNLEIERYLTLKKQIEERNVRAKVELNRYKTVEANLDVILANKHIESIQGEKAKEKLQSNNKGYIW